MAIKQCKAPGCDKLTGKDSSIGEYYSGAQGYCGGHYLQLKRGQPIRPLNEYNKLVDVCSVDGCEKRPLAKALCAAHYDRQRKDFSHLDGVPIRRHAKKGKGASTSGGYRTVATPRWHHLYGKRKRVLEHVLVMEECLGRPLVEGENVHHLNGNRADNRLENLELWNVRQPKGQRPADKVQYAKEILALYEPSALR